MEINEINKKIQAIREKQSVAVSSLNEMTQSINGNVIVSHEKIVGLTDSLASLVGAQDELIGDLKSFMGVDISNANLANHYGRLLTNGNADTLLATIDFEKFLTITSDDDDFREAIVALQEEVEDRALIPANEGYPAGIVSMINKAVESQDEFVKIKGELRNELKHRHLMVYTGLSERGYRFDTTVDENFADVPADESVRGFVDTDVPEQDIAEEYIDNNAVETTPADEVSAETDTEPKYVQTTSIREGSGTEDFVKWEGNSNDYKIQKCVNNFLEQHGGGHWYKKYPNFDKLKLLEDLQFYGLITVETYEKLKNKPDIDWLIEKEFIARSVPVVAGLTIISLSNRGAAVLDDKRIKEKLFGKAALKDKQKSISAAKFYKEKCKAEIMQILAVGEAAAALDQASDNIKSRTINFEYKFIVLVIGAGDKEYGICLCTQYGLSSDGCEMAASALAGMEYTTVTCACTYNDDGSFANEITAVDSNKHGFFVRFGEENDSAAEYLKMVMGELESVEEADEEEPYNDNAEENTSNIDRTDTDESAKEEETEETVVEDELAEEFVANGLVEEKTEESFNDAAATDDGEPIVEDAELVEHDGGVRVGAVELCKEILSMHTTPQKDTQKFYDLIVALIADNRIWDAIVLAKCLECESKEFKSLSDRLSYVAHISQWKQAYKDICESEIPTEEYKYPHFTYALSTAARLNCRTFFAAGDYSVNNVEKGVADGIASEEISKQYKALFKLLGELDVKNGGYTEQDVYSVENSQKHEDDIRVKASDLFGRPYTGIKSEQLVRPFGTDEIKTVYLKYIVEGKNDMANKTKQWLVKSFGKDSKDEFERDDEKVEKRLQHIWDCCKEKGDKALHSEAHDQAYKYLTERIDFIADWVRFRNATDNSTDKNKKIRSGIIAAAESLINAKSDSSEFMIPDNILRFVAVRICKFLRGDFDDTHCFESLLCDNEIMLDDNFLPEDLSLFKSVAGLEPWRRMLRHLIGEYLPLEAIEKGILEQFESPFYGNICTYRRICKLESRDAEKKCTHDFCEGKKKEALDYYKSCVAELEKEYLYGRIDELRKENMLATYRILFDRYASGSDGAIELGRFKHAIECVKSNIPSIISEIKQGLMLRLRALERSGDADNLQECLRIVKENIEKNNFTVADEYIIRLENGDTDIINQIDIGAGKDYLSEFLKEYDDIYKRMVLQKDKFSDRARGLITSRNSSDNRKAEEYFALWDKLNAGNQSNSSAAIQSLLRAIGFDAETVKKENVSSLSDAAYYSVKLEKDVSLNYPIAVFGSACDRLNVLCFYGESKADLIVKTVNSLKEENSATIVLFIGPIQKKRREEVFKEFKRSKRRKSFLLIDYCLAAYIATVGVGARKEAILKCTVPYAAINPYLSGNGANIEDVPPEMFFGRETELRQVSNINDGTFLLYGGRQLGKTALLRHIEKNYDSGSVNDGQFVVWMDVRRVENDGDDFFVKKVAEQLIKCKLISRNKEYRTNADICDQLRNTLETRRTQAGKPVESILLLIDEVNDYFAQLNSRKDTSELNAFSKLRGEYQSRFKFIFAGLHQVARYGGFTEGNTIMGHAASSICIMPFSPSEAMRLIRRPFEYLGITIDDSIIALLSSRANYYPGIMQAICKTIVEKIFEDVQLLPPYEVDERLLENVCKDAKISEMITSKIRITLDHDKDVINEFNAIATLLAFETKFGGGKMPSWGYGVQKLCELARDYGTKPINKIGGDEMRALLRELVEMSILRYTEEKDSYNLRKESFANIIIPAGEEAEREALAIIGGDDK